LTPPYNFHMAPDQKAQNLNSSDRTIFVRKYMVNFFESQPF